MTPPETCPECSVPLRLNDDDCCQVCGSKWEPPASVEPVKAESGAEKARRLRERLAATRPPNPPQPTGDAE